MGGSYSVEAGKGRELAVRFSQRDLRLVTLLEASELDPKPRWLKAARFLHVILNVGNLASCSALPGLDDDVATRFLRGLREQFPTIRRFCCRTRIGCSRYPPRVSDHNLFVELCSERLKCDFVFSLCVFRLVSNTLQRFYARGINILDRADKVELRLKSADHFCFLFF